MKNINTRFLILHFVIALLFITAFTMTTSSQAIKFNNKEPGIEATILQTNSISTTIEYVFNGYYQDELTVKGKKNLSLKVPDMVWLMEKGKPQLPIYRKSIIIPDRGAMNYRIISSEFTERKTQTIMPSKGHFTRDIDPATVPYTYDNIYNQNKWYPETNISIDEPYIVRDLRGMTIQFNPLQYNAVSGTLKVCKRIVIEIYNDVSKAEVNPFVRQSSLTKVASEFAPIYRDLFLNYGITGNRYDSIPEPGRLLVIYASQYVNAIAPLVQWKIQRGMTVLTADYPAQTGSGSSAIKTYIQNLYNSTGSLTYIILVGESNQIPTLNGVYEGAPSDPCYVKLAGTDAYPDAFISRISVPDIPSLQYVVRKLVRYEREPFIGSEALWYHKGTGVASAEGSPPDYTRANWLRDTLLMHGFTSIDQIYDPGATKVMVTNAMNDGRSLVNYIGHGSGTSWSTTGFNVSDIHSLSNGWKNPFIIDVACLNGDFTLSECMEEAWLRSGDTVNPKGAVGVFGSSTNASWVPPCDMQTHAVFLLAHGRRVTTGGICFLGIMYAMDLWGGSTGEGLKLMEQYNIFGDCTTMLTFGVPFGPSIVHTPLTNTENVNGPYVVNCSIIPMNSGIDPSKTRLLWTRGTVFADSVLLTKLSGNNWTANIPGNGQPALYKYYLKTADSMNRVVTNPVGAPAVYHSFQAMPDTTKPVIVHTALQDCPRNQWPVAVTAGVTDNIGLDSVWVRWYKNNTSTGIKHFKLNNTSGNNFSALFNSDTTQVTYNDSIFYRIFARDNSSSHNTDSTALNKFKLLAVATSCIGTGTTPVSYPYNTYWWGSKTDMLYISSEILNGGGAPGVISKIGFNVISAASQVMNGFQIKMQTTTASSVSGFVQSGWTTVYNGTYTVPGTGLQFVTLQNPFYWNGQQNLLVEICFGNSSYTSATTVAGSSVSGMTWEQHQDVSTACSFTGGSAQSTRPNICMSINIMVGTDPSRTEIPKVFSLAQNYPNPFNPTTSIKYSVPKQSMVNLVIYDVLGREVMKLVNEVKQPGVYSVSFDASVYASGVYFYRMSATGGAVDFTDVKKMVLIK